ncbi:YfcE family phosphodiesterase [Candidatus Fermentibacteria bacterium]|nr:MAG: YfcE family phosphodiesterase [Candidatus Fermentibacteria bacterium]PIE53259.1 MAG: YfcE family phosphodiesterase [Candidatus Fermentibacteria bacterium]
MIAAVISDTHIPVRLRALPGQLYEAVAEADIIIHAGDIEETDVIRDLERFAPVKAVHGNMDGCDTAKRYPDRFLMELEGFTIGLTHGSGARWGIRGRIRKMFEPVQPDIIIHGHTHRFFWDKENGIWFLNPGAIAGPKGKRSMAMLTLEKGTKPEVQQLTF